MSNLLAMIGTAGNALDVFQQALNVVQNNVSNSSTPGYARQSLNLEAMPLDVTAGLAGGVASAGLSDSRNQYAEEQVQRQTQTLGQYTAQAQATGSIQSLFDVTGSGGVPAALSALSQAFSAWSATPNDSSQRQNVIASANTLASSIHSLSSSLTSNGQQLDSNISSTTAQVNAIAGQIQAYNVDRLGRTTPDPGEDAQLHSALDNLSQLTNFSTVTQNDGTVTVMLGGGSPLVIGTQQNDLSAASSGGQSHILDSQGHDITSQVTSGQLGGLLDVRNRVLAGVIGDAQQSGSLNQFAAALADGINQTLQSGKQSSDPAAASGVALFTYDPANAAATFAVDPSVTPAQLAPVDATGTANGNANQLAALANAPNSALGGMTITQFLGQMTAAVGQENSTATSNQQSQQQVVAQATTLLNQASGVSLDQEAVNVLQFQRAYQASAQVLTVLNTLADSLLAIMPPA
jgi:flagellar hook-associated protein 1 FlgK